MIKNNCLYNNYFMFGINISQININKNTLMFITSMVYILGLSGFLVHHPIIFAVLISAVIAALGALNVIKLKYLLVWILVFYLGFFNAMYRISDSDILSNLAPLEGKFTGQIVSIPNSNIENNSKFFFKVSEIESDSKVYKLDNVKLLVNLKNNNNESGDYNKLKISDFYTIRGSLRRPFKPGNPSQFDYGVYLRNYGVHSILYSGIADVSCIDKRPRGYDLFMQKLNNLRGKIISTHAKYLKSPNLELLGGIVFGDDAVAPPDYIKTSFINSGLLHILAASGMNVAFIYGFWFIIAGWLRLPFKFRVAGGIPLIVIYAFMTGLGASVVRAAIMLIFVLSGKLIDRDSHSIALLSFVAFLMLLYNPAYINNVSFQLSFIVTLGILLCAPLVVTFGDNKKLTVKDRVLNWTAGTVFIPLIAQIWVIPIQVFYFNTISVYSLFFIIIAVPFLAVVSFGGFVSSILALVPVIGTFICRIFDFILNPFLAIIVKVSDFFASLPHSLIVTSHPGIFQIMIYYAIVLVLVYMIRNSSYNKKSAAVLVVLITILSISFIRIPNKNLDVIFFDVQNADCILLKTPKNKYIMIDTGKSGYNGGKSQAEFIVTKYLKDRGIKKLDTIIVTHFDNDHSGGAADLINYGHPDRIFLNSDITKTYTAKNIFKTLDKNRNTQINYAKNGEVIYKEPDLKITNYFAGLNPLEEDNENSIITLAEYGKTKLLFTGDAGIKAFNSIVWEIPDIDILKVPHHGAEGVLNKTILEKLSPSFAVISVGRNIYGHPAKSTLELLNDIPYARTDLNNAVKISVTKSGYKVYYWDMKYKKFQLQH